MRAIDSDRDATGRTGDRTTRVELGADTVDRLDTLREDGETYDDVVTELLDIYEASTMTMAHAGDALAEPVDGAAAPAERESAAAMP